MCAFAIFIPTSRRSSALGSFAISVGVNSMCSSESTCYVTAAEADYFKVPLDLEDIEGYSAQQIEETIARLDFEMRDHAKKFEFEKAAELRDRIKYLRERELVVA